MNTIVARMVLFGQKPGENRFQIRVEIGTPYQCDCDGHEWACPVALVSLYEKFPDIRGNDSLQALCLAVRFAQTPLEGFREVGGVLMYEDGEEVPLETIFFRTPKARPAQREG